MRAIFYGLAVLLIVAQPGRGWSANEAPLAKAEIFGISVGEPFNWKGCGSPQANTEPLCFTPDKSPPFAPPPGYVAYTPSFRDRLPFPFEASDLHLRVDAANRVVDDIRIDFPAAFAQSYFAPFIRKFGKPRLRTESNYMTASWSLEDGAEVQAVIDGDLGHGVIEILSARAKNELKARALRARTGERKF